MPMRAERDDGAGLFEDARKMKNGAGREEKMIS